MIRFVLGVSLVVVSSCRCGSITSGVDSEVVVAATDLHFADTWVGAQAEQTLEVTNRGRAGTTLTLSIEGNAFSVDSDTLELGGGSTVTLTLRFAPSVAGDAIGTLNVSGQPVTLSGVGLGVPVCEAPTCSTSSFDFSSGQCVSAVVPNGSSCDDACLTSARCEQGQCIGTPKDCGDADACTVDACSAGGCVHTPRTCPAPTNPCRVATCDSVSGCLETDAPDGTLCGPDSCLNADVNVCLAGQCQTRPRPRTRRCSNTWVPVQISARSSLIAWDPVRQQSISLMYETVVSGSHTAMWSWNGSDWVQLFPPAMPEINTLSFMVTDTRRQRVLFLSVGDPTVWEWDGSTWVVRPTQGTGPDQTLSSVVWDSVRQRLVAFGWGPSSTGSAAVVFELDGQQWTRRMPATEAHVIQKAAFDPTRRAVVGLASFYLPNGTLQSETWQWDGADFSPLPTNPPQLVGGFMTWDEGRQVVLHLGGQTSGGSHVADVYALEGTSWVRKPSTGAPLLEGSGAWDPVRQVLNVLSASLWQWNGTSWTNQRQSPPPHELGTTVYDPAHQRLITVEGSDTFVWDAQGWRQLATPTSPTSRVTPTLVWDSTNQRVLMSSGFVSATSTARLADLWAFDGQTWSQLLAPGASPARLRATAWDSQRQRLVGLTNNDFDHVWEFDGTQWSTSPAAQSVDVRYSGHAAFDAAHGVTLFDVGGNATWNGAAWTEFTQLVSTGQGLAWDPTRNRVVRVDYTSTSEWDGAQWLDLGAATTPLMTGSLDLLYFDVARQHLVALINDGTEQWVYLP